MNVEYRKKIDHIQKLNVAKLSNLLQIPFRNIAHLLEQKKSEDFKNFK